jgi:hypothetical protein
MEKDQIVPVDAALIQHQTVIKEKKDSNFNIDRSNVTFNIDNVTLSGQKSSTSQDLIAVQSFSTKYYQLLVTCEEDVFENQYVTVSKDRALTQYLVPDEIFERCSTLSDTGIAELKTFPAIICRENPELRGIADPNQFAMYAYITKVFKTHSDIKVAFHPLMPIRQQILCERKNSIYFELDMESAITDLNHSAWYVKKTNLFEAFNEVGLGSLPHPY